MPYDNNDLMHALASGGTPSILRTILYFAALLAAAAAAATAFPYAAARKTLPLALLAIPYALAALAITWYLILSFFVEHTRTHAADLEPPNLFVDAYRNVCDTAAGWVWSLSLLTWVCAACPLVALEASRAGLRAYLTLAHMVLAFLGAVSLSFPLLFVQLLLPDARRLPAKSVVALSRLWPPCLVAALASTAALPLTVRGPSWAFVTPLALVHGVLLLPFCADLLLAARRQVPDASTSSAAPRALYTSLLFSAVGIASATLHWLALYGAVREWQDAVGYGILEYLRGERTPFSRHLYMAALRNDCQASIATDALLATIAGGVYMAVRAGRVGVLLALASPVISPAAALALFAIWRELRAAASTYGADEARAAGATAVAAEPTGAAAAAATATATTAAAAAAPPLRGRPSPLGGRLLPLRRGACHYYLDGAESDGPLVVLIHGMVGSGGYMGSLAGALSRGAPHRRRRVLRLDMPGRGLTECDGSPHTERSFAAHVAEALAQLGEDCAPVDVVGYSMGGAVAMAFAAGWPHLCRSVALLCAAGTSAVPMPRTLPLLLRMPVVPHILARRLVAAGALQGPHEWEAPHGPVWERHATEEARRACDERDTLARAVINTLLHFPMDNCEAHLAAVHHARIPVLAVWAEEDGIIPLASAARVRAVAPHAETIVVPGARHALPLERGPDVADMMLRWWWNAAAGRPRARSGATPSAATLSLVERTAIRARRNARSPRRR